MLDASDLGISIGTFTAHRSPLALVFDNDSLLGSDLRGEAFMLSWTKGCDSTGGYATANDTAIGPFVDPGQDLTHLHLMYDAVHDLYTLNATRIVADFANPVAAKIDSNKIYVLEWAYAGTAGLYEITLPLFVDGIQQQSKIDYVSIFPNPTTGVFQITSRELRMLKFIICTGKKLMG